MGIGDWGLGIGLRVVVNVNDSHQPVAVLSEVVNERRVLPHGGVAVGGVVIGCLVVAKKDDGAAANEFFELLAPPNVRVFVKHKSKI